MSNTFAWFRKNEKLAFAILTLVAIIAFVASDFFLSWSRRDSRDSGGSTTLVSFEGRNISIDEFRNLMSAHHAAFEFTNRVAQLASDSRTTSPKAFDAVPRATEMQFAQFLFFSDQAKQQGIDFSNDEIKSYLRDLSDDAPLSEIAKVRDEVIRDGRVVTEEKLFDAIRTDLRRQQFIRLTASGFFASNGQRAGAVVPGEEWENFKRIYRRVSVEAIPLKVSDFESEVKGTPTDAELKELYEKGKDYFAGNPYTPIAGMVLDRKLAFQFVKIDQSEIEKEEMAKITDEEVRKLYDQRVEKKDRSVTETVPVDQSGTGKPDEGSEKTEGDSGTEGAKPADDEATGDKPASEESNQDKPPEGESTDEKSTDEKSKEDKSAEPSSDPPAAEEGKQSSTLKGPAEYFTGLQEEPAEDKEEKQPEEKSAETDAVPEKSEGDKPAEESATEENAAEKPADKEGDTASETTTETEEEPAAIQRPKRTPPKTETRVLPFEKVREDLRKELAAPAVNVREEKIFNAIQGALDAFQKAHKKWENEVKKSPIDKVGKGPVADDFLNPVLKDLMLEAEAYAPKDQFEINDTELGKIRWFDGQSLQRFSAFYRGMYQQVTAPFRCTRLDGQKPFRYIWWVTKDEPQKQLSEEEATERLKAAWRKAKAFDLAVAAAKDLSKKAAEAIEKKTSKDERNLASAFAEKPPQTGEVFKTKDFSWYDLGNLPFGSGGQITLSEVPEVEFAGEDFMKAVFALKLGETGVAHDAGQNLVYVIRIASEGPSSDQLRQDFIERSPDIFTGTISRNQAARSFDEWIRDLSKRRGFDAMQLRSGGE